MLQRLLDIYKEHKRLYITGAVLALLPCILRFILPHLSFLMTFLTFSGVCTVIYGLLLHFEGSSKKATRITSKILRITALCLIALFLITQIIIQYRIISAIGTTDEECEYILVLGCGLRGQTLTRAGVSRADAAIAYLNEHPDTRAVLCGGRGTDEIISESEALYRYMTANGIDPERMVKEERSTDTTENIHFAFDIVKDEAGSLDDINVAVVTNEFHLYRSMLIMEKAGFCNIHPINGPTPRVPFMHLCMFLREYFSVILEYMNI